MYISVTFTLNIHTSGIRVHNIVYVHYGNKIIYNDHTVCTCTYAGNMQMYMHILKYMYLHVQCTCT